MTTVRDIYKALAVRINYPVEPTYRCLQKIIGYINLLISLSNTPQVIVEVPLSGEPNKRFYNRIGEKVAYLKNGKPCPLNPDGTIRTADSTAYVIRTGMFQSLDTGEAKKFVTSDTDILSDDFYLQPILTSLYLTLNGVNPSEAVMYINSACTKSFTQANLKQINMSDIRRKL